LRQSHDLLAVVPAVLAAGRRLFPDTDEHFLCSNGFKIQSWLKLQGCLVRAVHFFNGTTVTFVPLLGVQPAFRSVMAFRLHA
jgi:hypothetical protein